jgi:phenylacetate-coenzyme A ligase PaaK-like adenylate-forming protein
VPGLVQFVVSNVVLERCPVTTYDVMRRRHFGYAMAQLPAHVDRMDWSAERISAEREMRLRRLLALARARSSWHRDRLHDVDVTTFSTAQLPDLAPMTKDDVLAHFDRIVTDQRLSLTQVEDHLGRLTSDAYLLDEHHAIASGGSSGRRGVYVYDWDGWAGYFLGIARRHAYDRRHDPVLAAAPSVEGLIAADKPTHGSSAQSQTFSNPRIVIARIPITLPLPEVVTRLNALGPTTVRGYPSALDQLAAEAEAGRLRIAPLRVRCVGEPLLPEVRERLERVWDAPVHSQWIASEAGCLGYSCLRGRGLHLNDDLVIVEPVDELGRPVPPGQASAKIYITNLFNDVLPLIRFEVSDQITVVAGSCSCGCAHTWIEDVQGRFDDSFHYPAGSTVHPIVVGSPLGRQSNIAEYQVQQTPRGVRVLLRLAGPVDLSALHAELTAALTDVGLIDPDVTLTPVDGLGRQGSGKLKRFIPLSPTPEEGQ